LTRGSGKRRKSHEADLVRAGGEGAGSRLLVQWYRPGAWNQAGKVEGGEGWTGGPAAERMVGEELPMTEEQWLKCKKRPDTMLASVASRATERKLRLYACACTRHVWPHLIAEDHSRELLELHERYADGLISREEVVAAGRPAWEAVGTGFDSSVKNRGKEETPEKRAVVVASLSQASAVGAAMFFTDQCWQRDNDQEKNKLCQYFREIFGPLLFRPVTINAAWLTPTVTNLAQAIYDERAFEQMPVLADALEDAGCTSTEMLNHCRQPGVHVRGCWVVDLILGKS
jgi:hypothetical protein